MSLGPAIEIKGARWPHKLAPQSMLQPLSLTIFLCGLDAHKGPSMSLLHVVSGISLRHRVGNLAFARRARSKTVASYLLM